MWPPSPECFALGGVHCLAISQLNHLGAALVRHTGADKRYSWVNLVVLKYWSLFLSQFWMKI